MVGRVFLGRYQTIRLLGEGGMGRVYLARQLDLGRQVVVKVMHDHIAADPKFCERFQRETLLMARFQHPYAVTLYDASSNDPQGPCIIMEYIRGVTLDNLLRRNQGRLSPARVGRLLGQLCEVLQAAHSQSIIHRDIKPSNLMVVDADTPYEKIKVMDFGLAKLIDQPSLKEISVTGGEFAIGTPAYICPEQVRGESMDHRGDLYSVGVILYELLTGRTPFTGQSTMDVLLAHATEEPPPFSNGTTSYHIPPAIEAVVLDCLAKNPASRPASARDLAERYETALAHEEVVQELAMPEDASDPAQTARPVAVPEVVEPGAVAFRLEAWMPEAIAVHKLRGFLQDFGGEVVQSAPGVVRVQLGGPGTPYQPRNRGTSWLGIRRRTGAIDLELRMQQADPQRPNLLLINVLMRAVNGDALFDPQWQALFNQVFCDLRGYLMGQSGEDKR
jgi:eukaryotic-like serine/threonine-protein kinase